MFHYTSLILIAFVTLSARADQPDWTAFSNPKQVLLTDAFAKTISELPAAERASTIERLHKTLSSSNIEIRRRAALTLGALGDKRGVPTMISDMATESSSDRDNIVVALRLLKDRRAVPVLRAALADKSPYVRGIALAALGEIKATEAFTDIVAHLRDKQYQEGTCIPMSPAFLAAYGLGALGDRRAIPVLIQLLDDRDLQGSATQALSSLTGESFGQDVASWKNWWAASQKMR